MVPGPALVKLFAVRTNIRTEGEGHEKGTRCEPNKEELEVVEG